MRILGQDGIDHRVAAICTLDMIVDVAWSITGFEGTGGFEQKNFQPTAF
jgi:hypothetical protein